MREKTMNAREYLDRKLRTSSGDKLLSGDNAFTPEQTVQLMEEFANYKKQLEGKKLLVIVTVSEGGADEEEYTQNDTMTEDVRNLFNAMEIGDVLYHLDEYNIHNSMAFMCRV
jgi:predicted flavoprotein YhiN